MNADLNRISEAVIGCAYRVSNALGSGFLESVYDNAMALELAAHGVFFERQKKLEVRYRDTIVGEFAADFLVEHRVIVELKSVRTLLPEHHAQLLNYLHASNLNIGLLVNFGASRVQIKRLVNNLQSE